VNNTESGESQGLRGGGGMKDDDVESFRRCCALMIRIVLISKSRLGHTQLHLLCPPATPLFIAQHDGAHNHGSVGAPDQCVRSNGNGDSVPFHWSPVGVNLTVICRHCQKKHDS
jgi:hypothetical protein